MPDPAADPDGFDRLVRAWTRYAEGWARRQEARCPGEDWWPPAATALWKAAASYTPGRNCFLGWLKVNLRNEMAGPMRRWRRRRARFADVCDRCGIDADAASPGPGAGDEPDRRLSLVRAALADLPRRQSAILRRRLDGEAVAEIARSRGVAPDYVERETWGALRRLRATLGPPGAPA